MLQNVIELFLFLLSKGKKIKIYGIRCDLDLIERFDGENECAPILVITDAVPLIY